MHHFLFVTLFLTSSYLASAGACDYSIRGCTDCSITNSSQCQTCDYNFTLTVPSYTCDCQNYYYLNTNKTACLVCDDLFGANCLNCSLSPENNTYCSNCQYGLYWNNNFCDQCSNSLPNCSYCSNNGSTCFNCVNNTYLVDYQCIPCELALY